MNPGQYCTQQRKTQAKRKQNMAKSSV